MRKKISVLVIISLIIIFLLGIIDYYGFLNLINIKTENFNFEFWNILINSIIVIILYIITYLVIDRKNLIQYQNKKKTAHLLLRDVYNNCIEDIEWMQKKDYRYSIAKKIDFDKDINVSLVYKRLIETPFVNQDLILSYAKEGIIEQEIVNDYFNVKKEFRIFINMSITFFDKYELVQKEINQISDEVNNALSKLPKE